LTAQALPPVLIVDDDAALRHILRALLEDEGYPVSQVATAADGLAHLRAARSGHVVLLDFLLPDGDGGDVLRATEQGASLRRHRFLLMTATSATIYPREEPRLLAEGCQDVIYKPFELDVLLNAVAAAAAELARTQPPRLLSGRCVAFVSRARPSRNETLRPTLSLSSPIALPGSRRRGCDRERVPFPV
jgi:CheY-like chemotaxis protein